MKNRKIRPPKHDPHSEYHRIWRIVDGAVRDTFKHHPEYLTKAGHMSAQESIIKRVTGSLHASFVAGAGLDPVRKPQRGAEPDLGAGG